MATDYGIDLAAVDDLPASDVLVSGETTAAYRVARRLLTPSGGLEDVGDTTPYLSLDVREWLGRRLDADAIRDLERQVLSVVVDDPEVDTATVSVSFGAGALSVSVDAQGAAGPFSFVLSVDGVSAATLQVA